MAVDYARRIRVEVIAALAANPALPIIYPVTTPANPAWPFVRYGAPIVAPFRLSGLDSSSVRGSLHVFAKPVYDDDGAQIVTAEDAAMQLAEALATAIDNMEVTVAPDMTARLAWTGTTGLIDGDEPDAWHAVVSFTAEVAG